MTIGEKYHKAETDYEEGDAEYDGADYNFQIVDGVDDIICLCPDEKTRNHIHALLVANPIPE